MQQLPQQCNACIKREVKEEEEEEEEEKVDDECHKSGDCNASLHRLFWVRGGDVSLHFPVLFNSI